MTGFKVHPVADLFPMLADDELKELAEDIRQRGLLQPIVLDADGRVLDGRNRLAACEMAGVEPTFSTYDGDDPDGYALAVNGQRREMNKRQKAVVAARFSNLESRGDQRKAARALGIPESSVSEAKLIVRYGDLAEAVLARVAPKPFSAALDEARARDRRTAEEGAAKERLRAGAPDLLVLVEDERVSLDEALSALKTREEKARQSEALAERVAKLPADLAERVDGGGLGIDEAETVVKERAERLAAWAEKIRAGLETFTRMAGNPVPAELAEHLTDEEANKLAAVVGALENGARE